MKIKNTVLLFFFFALIYANSPLIAQSVTFTGEDTPPPPLHFTLNAGYGLPNLIGNSIKAMGYGSNNGNFNPVYFELGYNYSSKGLLSFYGSYSQANTGDFFWADTANTIYGYNYSVSIVTFGLSTEYHFGNNEHFLPYFGAMLGYRFINLSASGDLSPVDAATVNLSTFNYHVYAGLSWYFLKWMGLDIRAGYGNSYYASMGLSFRFLMNRDE